MAINETVKLLIAIVIGAAVLYGIQYIGRLQEQAAVGQQRGAVIETTSGVIKDGQQSEQQRVKVEVDVTAAREQFQRDIQEARNNEPETRSNADVRNPDSVLRAARARRLARERSAGDPSER